MPIIIKEYVRNRSFPKGGDFKFSNVKELLERTSHLLPKLEGTWEISLDRPTLEEFRTVQSEYKDCSHIILTIYVTKQNIFRIQENFPKLRIGENSNWEKFLDTVFSSGIYMDTKASKEMYRRLKGNLEKVVEILTKYKEVGKEVMTLADVKREVVDIPNMYYPRDLILYLLLNKNNLVPKKGSRYSKYKYYKFDIVFNEVFDLYEHRVIFYAIRKFLRLLFEEKMKVLRGESSELEVLTTYLSIYEISRVYLMFEQSTPGQIHALVHMLNESGNTEKYSQMILDNRREN